jgi:hypothetical protein
MHIHNSHSFTITTSQARSCSKAPFHAQVLV